MEPQMNADERRWDVQCVSACESGCGIDPWHEALNLQEPSAFICVHLRFHLSESVKAKSTSGLRPEMMSASALPEPQAMVQPSVPWPVLRKRFGYFVPPMMGTLEGVEGL